MTRWRTQIAFSGWLFTALLVFAVLLTAVPALAGGHDDPGAQPAPPPDSTESATAGTMTPLDWVLLLLGTTLLPAALAVWRR
ncbi:MAG: hypothetical protein PVF68_15145 [Acidobacteriota bacterium]|jgi:hypothetical protein